MVLIQDHRADIGGKIYAFLKGKEYRVSADVKRILFDGGLVDISKSGTHSPSNVNNTVWDMGDHGDNQGNIKIRSGDATEGGCPVWDAGDEGLLPEQVERAGGIYEYQQYCPTCDQKYGSGPRLTEIIAERQAKEWDGEDAPPLVSPNTVAVKAAETRKINE